MIASRRFVLSGLATMAALPGATHAAPSPTPLEAAGERIRLAWLGRITGAPSMPHSELFDAVRALRDLGLPDAEFQRAGRQAFRAARLVANS